MFIKTGLILSASYTILSFIIYWDPTRIYFVRLKADSPYTYDRVHPKFSNFNTAHYISIQNSSQLNSKRKKLINLIWNNSKIPTNIMPSNVITEYNLTPSLTKNRSTSNDKKSFFALYDKLDLYTSINNLKQIDRISISNNPHWESHVGVFIPKVTSGRLIIYHNGFASTYHNQWRLIGDMVNKGHTVAAHNFRWYGTNTGTYNINSLKTPLRGFFEPVIVSINYLLKGNTFKTVDMIGLSAGAWLTSIIAAVDTRVSHSYLVSGTYPMSLREGNEFPLPEADKILLSISSYLDIFVMGGHGRNRGQVQIFNKFDRCCFRNEKGLLYEKNVSDIIQHIGPGRFDVVIDKTHARHKISRYAFDIILTDIHRNGK